MKIYFKERDLEINVREVGFFGKFSGLMFKTSCTRSLFFRTPNVGIHSWFVFFDFLIVWLDEKKNVLSWEVVRPFTSYVKPRHKFKSFIEVPINEKNKKIVEFFVGKRKV